MNWTALLAAISGIAPLAMLIFLGFGLTKIRFLGPEFILNLSRLAYWVALPAFLISQMSRIEFSPRPLWVTLLVVGGASSTVAVLSYFAARKLGHNASNASSVAQCSFRGNAVFVGLPLVAFVLEPLGLPPESQGFSLLVLGPSVAVYNVLSVLVFILGQHRAEPGLLKKLGISLVTNPLLVSCFIGLLMAATGFSPGSEITRALDLLAAVALPTALLCIGGTMAGAKIRELGSQIWLPTFGKLIVAPLVTLLFCWALGLEQGQTLVLVMYACCPVAATAFATAREMGGNGVLTSAVVGTTTVGCLIPIVVVIAFAAAN